MIIHPIKATRAAWDAFWQGASRMGARADAEGMGKEVYQRDLERFIAFSSVKKLVPDAVTGLEHKAAGLIYDLVMLDPGTPGYSEKLIHLHGQFYLLVKQLLTEFLNAETYAEITRKEMAKAEDEKMKRRTG